MSTVSIVPSTVTMAVPSPFTPLPATGCRSACTDPVAAAAGMANSTIAAIPTAAPVAARRYIDVIATPLTTGGEARVAPSNCIRA
jgi:hypothetical protein